MYDKVEILRKSIGITNYRLAKETGIPQTHLSQVKLGKRNFGLKSIKKLAAYFGVTVDFFLDDSTENEKTPIVSA